MPERMTEHDLLQRDARAEAERTPHSPPIVRAATSISASRAGAARSSTRTSACTGPSVSPIVAAPRADEPFDVGEHGGARGATA